MAKWAALSVAKCTLVLSAIAVTIVASQPMIWAQEMAKASGWVVISVPEYKALRSRAYPAALSENPTPPVDATLTRVDYDLEVNSELATGKANLTVDVLKDGWARVPIPPGLLVRQARLDGKPLALVPAAAKGQDGQLMALLSQTGRSMLQLDIALPINAATGTESITLPATGSGVTHASLHLPRQGVEVHVAGGLLTERGDDGAATKWVAYGHGDEALTFSWRRRIEDHRSTQPLRMRGSLTELVSLGEDATMLSTEVSVHVTQGITQEVRLTLPENVTINQVSGAAVADWEMKPGELVVGFLEPVEKATSFVITGETQLPRDGAIAIPMLRLINAERETGGIAVEVLGAGEIKGLHSQGLEDADASDLGEMVASRQSQSMAAFRFRAGDSVKRTLSVNVARYTQQAVLLANVEEARYRVMITGDGKMLVQARYAVRNNQRNFIKITLPPGAVAWSAALEGKPIRPGQASDGSLLLPLERGRGGDEAPEFAVEMVYFDRAPKWADKGSATLALPALDLPISRTGLQVYYPPRYRVNAETGTFRSEPFAEPLSPVLVAEAIEPVPMAPVAMAGPMSAGAMTKSGTNEYLFRGQANSFVDGQVTNQTGQDQGTVRDKKQDLVDKFRAKSQGGRTSGILPVRVSFPAYGPSVYMVSELTSPSQAPQANFSYQRDKKAGSR
jgi:hypothetical protein